MSQEKKKTWDEMPSLDLTLDGNYYERVETSQKGKPFSPAPEIPHKTEPYTFSKPKTIQPQVSKTNLFNFFSKPKTPSRFNKIRISIASPEKILDWSHGEVKKPETINYRTFQPEPDGLFCSKIFGPIKDFECVCGKYTRIKHRGVVCEKCGVEVIQSKVRRERIGHINLAAPVAHIWFLKSQPSKIGAILDLTLKQLEKVLYFEQYVVTYSHAYAVPTCTLLTEEQYRQMREAYPGEFEVGVGAEAIHKLLAAQDLKKLSMRLREECTRRITLEKHKKYKDRLAVIETLLNSTNMPEWMILKVLPVLPPDLRPLVPLEGGRFATSDMNDLYRRVINRNNRLKRLLDLDAPDIIIRNEKRKLQEAVDVLFDNGRRGRVITGANKRPLKSLSDMLKGKQGRFRQNLLGKRVDYSGRSVIVVGPQLRLHQCGIPKVMALELFKPFVYNKLETWGYVTTIKDAREMVKKQSVEVWDALDAVVTERLVILNRAPTLHRLGMLAFEVVLVESKAIQLHPLVCAGFNADFDGDQMAVHVPLSVEAQVESRVLLMASSNILSPANGEPVIVPSQDIVLGLYYMTKERVNVTGEDKIFSNFEEARIAYDHKAVHLQARVKISIESTITETTIGRSLIGTLLPAGIPFSMVNRLLDKNALIELIKYTLWYAGTKATVVLLDQLKELGFEYATMAGISICMDDIKNPLNKKYLLKRAEHDVSTVNNQYYSGSITSRERHGKIVSCWVKAAESINEEVKQTLQVAYYKEYKDNWIKDTSFNPLFLMVESGARSMWSQNYQLAGMCGLQTNPYNRIFETPIKSCYRDGLQPLEYFLSTYRSRRKLANRAIKTANAGYLTRRLVDVAQHVIIIEENCHSQNSTTKKSLVNGIDTILPVSDRVLGRTASEKIIDPYTNDVIVEAGQQILEEHLERLEYANIDKVNIRSILTCCSQGGVCAKCYGRDLARGHSVNCGEAIGIIAAQSIGERCTQLMLDISAGTGSMRTYTGGLSRIATLFEARKPSKSAIISEIDGKVSFSHLMSRMRTVIVTPEYGECKKYIVPNNRGIVVETGEFIHAGEPIVKGEISLNDILNVFGENEMSKFVIDEIQRVFCEQGVKINDKHIEVIVRQMLRRVEIISAGDSKFMIGDKMERWEFEAECKRLIANNLQPMSATTLLLGVTRASMYSKSFISAASFQETTKVLTDAALAGATDLLTGIKENVVMGRLINAGTGFKDRE